MSFSISDPSTRTSFSVSLNSMDFIHCTESYGGGTGVSPVQPGGDARLSTGMAGPARASAPHTVYSIVCQTHPTEPVASGQWPVASFGTEDDLPGSTEFRLTQKASRCRTGYWQLGTGNWVLATGNCISRRTREEIPGSFGRRGGAVCDVVGAGSRSHSHSRSSSGPGPSSRANSNSRSTSTRQPREGAAVSALRTLWRRYVRRDRFLQCRTLGGIAGLGRFSGCERDKLAGVRVGRRPILRNLKDPESRAGAVSIGSILRADAVSHLQRDDARVQLSFRRAIVPPQVWTLDAVCRTAVRAPGRTRRGDPSNGISRHGNRHWPGDSDGRRPRPPNQSAFRSAIQGRLPADRHRVSGFRQTEAGQLPVLDGHCSRQCAQEEAPARGRNSARTVGRTADRYSSFADRYSQLAKDEERTASPLRAAQQIA